MADDIQLNTGIGGDVLAAEDIAGVKFEKVIPHFGPAGTATKVDKASGQGLPIQGEAAHDAPATGNPVLMGALADQTLDAVDDGDVGALRIMNTNRALKITVWDRTADRGANVNSSNQLSVNVGNTSIATTLASGNVVTNTGTLAALNATVTFQRTANGLAAAGGILVVEISGTWTGTISFSKLNGFTYATAFAHNGTDLVSSTTSNGYFYFSGASEFIKLEMTAFTSGSADVQGAGYPMALAPVLSAPLPTGSNAIGKLAANSGVDIGDVDVTSIVMPTGANAAQVQGTVAHGSADAQNPVKIGAKIETALSTATMEADGERTDLYADMDGVLVVRQNHPLGDLITERVSNTDGASTAFSNFAAVASTRNYVTAISIKNTHATTDAYVDFRDGTAGSILWTVAAPAAGGAIVANGGHPLFKTTANTALAFDVSAAVTTIYISVTGFQSKVT